jgi:hypothetical protein
VIEPAERAVPLAQASREVAKLSHEASDARASSQRSAERVIEVEQLLADSQALTLALESSLAEQNARAEELQQRLDRADRVMSAMKASLSWRITAPLRRLKRRR